VVRTSKDGFAQDREQAFGETIAALPFLRDLMLEARAELEAGGGP